MENAQPRVSSWNQAATAIFLLLFCGFARSDWRRGFEHPAHHVDSSDSADVSSSGNDGRRGSGHHRAARVALFMAWTRAYGLDDSSLLPPDVIKTSPSNSHPTWTAMLLGRVLNSSSIASMNSSDTDSAGDSWSTPFDYSTEDREMSTDNGRENGNASSRDIGSGFAQLSEPLAGSGDGEESTRKNEEQQQQHHHHPPIAPHLQDCAALHSFQLRAESRGANGEMPWWNVASNCSDYAPDPPWVLGTNAANLAMTRVVQRDLWVHQFPPGNCSSARLAVFEFPKQHSHGLGSQLHVLSAALDFAVKHKRVLTLVPGSFGHANHSACEVLGQRLSFQCYFFPVSSPACQRRAEAELPAVTARQAGMRISSPTETKRLFASRASTVLFPHHKKWTKQVWSHAATRWGTPWLLQPPTEDIVLPSKSKFSSSLLREVHWWRAQSLRFILRWPSPYLCHLTNRIRHRAFGLAVAGQVVEAHLERVQLLREMRGGKGRNDGGSEGEDGGRSGQRSEGAIQGVKEVKGVEAEMIAGGSILMREVWAARGAAASGRHAEAVAVGRGNKKGGGGGRGGGGNDSASSHPTLTSQTGSSGTVAAEPSETKAAEAEVGRGKSSDDGVVAGQSSINETGGKILRGSTGSDVLSAIPPGSGNMNSTTNNEGNNESNNNDSVGNSTRNEQAALGPPASDPPKRQLAESMSRPERGTGISSISSNSLSGPAKVASTFGAAVMKSVAPVPRRQLAASPSPAVSGSGSTSASARGEAMPCVPTRVVEEESGRKVRYVVPDEPLMPRPIVSIHVRQGDKGHEMRLMSFKAFMLAGNRLRDHQPFLKNVWLSTEMQSVIDATSHYKSWRFFYTDTPRQRGNITMSDYGSMVGTDVLVGVSFANLILASQCDYFVGVLGSNWNRLINELRSTNGRLQAGYITLNYGQW